VPIGGWPRVYEGAPCVSIEMFEGQAPARQVYRANVKSGMMPTPAQPVFELIDERRAERL
jgi:hypothetical protein